MAQRFGADFLAAVMDQTKSTLGEFMRNDERIDPTGSFGFGQGRGIDPTGGFMPYGREAITPFVDFTQTGGWQRHVQSQQEMRDRKAALTAEKAKTRQPGEAAAAPREYGQPGAPKVATPTGLAADQLRAAIVARAIERFGEAAGPVVNALLIQEGGLTGNVGDQDIGGSYGPFQFYTGGQLRNYARDRNLDVRQAGDLARTNPMDAAEWAFDTYIGGALQRGIQAGLSGPALMQQVLRVQNPGADPNKYSQHLQAPIPQRARQNLPEFIPEGTPPGSLAPGSPDRQNLPITPQTPPATRQNLGNVAWAKGVSQNELGLSARDAAVFCGPAAAMWFINQNGRAPSVEEALNLAREVGWGPAGMGGVQRAVNLINRMGGNASYQGYHRGIENRIRDEVLQGRPVIIDTPGHYYQVVGYNLDTGRFMLGDAVGRRLTNGVASMQELGVVLPQYGAARSVILSND